MSTHAVDFDGGPLHEATLLVDSDEHGVLPTVVWTDEGDYPVVYVLSGGIYGYDSDPPSESERVRCPYIDANRRDP